MALIIEYREGSDPIDPEWPSLVEHQRTTLACAFCDTPTPVDVGGDREPRWHMLATRLVCPDCSQLFTGTRPLTLDDRADTPQQSCWRIRCAYTGCDTIATHTTPDQPTPQPVELAAKTIPKNVIDDLEAADWELLTDEHVIGPCHNVKTNPEYAELKPRFNCEICESTISAHPRDRHAPIEAQLLGWQVSNLDDGTEIWACPAHVDEGYDPCTVRHSWKPVTADTVECAVATCQARSTYLPLPRRSPTANSAGSAGPRTDAESLCHT